MLRLEPLENRQLFSATNLNTNFSGDGLVTTDFAANNDRAAAVAVQSDGKIVVAGDALITGTDGHLHHAFAVVRYNADGTLDDGGNSDSTPSDSFGTAGKFTYYEGALASATSIAIQRDGKIIVAGTADSDDSSLQQYWVIVRLNSNGTFDHTFAEDGVFTYPFSTVSTPLNAIGLESDGKIVAVGSFNNDFLVARLTTAGDFDDSFNDGGTITTDFGGTDSASGVAFDNLGNIVVSGVANSSHIATARYQPNGTLDPNFGHSGLATDSVTHTSLTVGNVAVLPDGTICVPFTEVGNNGTDGGIKQFQTDGSDGASNSVVGERVDSIVMMPDGKLATDATDVSQSHLGVSIDGALGSIFTAGTGAAAVTAAPDGSIFVAGYVNTGSNLDFMLAKFIGNAGNTWGSISGNVFRDLDGDHVLDSNEHGMANVRVYVDLNNDGMYTISSDPSALTDANGNFTIRDNILVASTIREVVPPTTTQSSPLAASYSMTVTGGRAIRNINFGNAPAPTSSTKTQINGSVFFDWNGNALRDVSNPVEPDLAGEIVFIDSNRNGRLDKGETQATTNVSGNYSLTLPKNGTYRVEVVTPAGYANSTPAFFDVTVHTHQQVSEHFGLSYADPNDTEKEATAIAPGTTVAGKISYPLDVNMYRFTVTADETIFFDENAARGSSLNSYLRLFDSGGHQLAANDNGNVPDEPVGVNSFLQYTFATAGTYYIGISDHLNFAYSPRTGIGDIGGGTKGGYTLTLS